MREQWDLDDFQQNSDLSERSQARKVLVVVGDTFSMSKKRVALSSVWTCCVMQGIEHDQQSTNLVRLVITNSERLNIFDVTQQEGLG